MGLTKLREPLKRGTDPSGRQRDSPAGPEEASCCVVRGATEGSMRKGPESHNSKELSPANNHMRLEEELPRGTPWFQPWEMLSRESSETEP